LPVNIALLDGGRHGRQEMTAVIERYPQ